MAAAEGVTNAYNTTNGMKASTTGTIYGVYDMSGGAWERTAAYINNGHGNLATNSSSLVNGASKYKNVYTADKQWTESAPDSQSGNYDLSTPNNGHYGDAVYETSSAYTGQGCWYKDYSIFPYARWTIFERGGYCNDESGAGVFYFGGTGGGAGINSTFRVVVPVL